MKNNESIIIIGANIIGLYAAIKCLDMGYLVYVLDKNNNILNKNNYYQYYNENHLSFISLIKKFNIETIKNKKDIDNEYNNIYINIIDLLVEKSKSISKHILTNITFENLCTLCLSNELYKYISIYSDIFSKISAIDFLNIFTTELNNNLTYNKINIDLLIIAMVNYIYKKGGKIIFKTFVLNINYNNKKFIVNTSNKTYYSTILISVISKKNLLYFPFWNTEQINYLNNVINIDTISLNNIYNNYIYNEDDNKYKNIKNYLLIHHNLIFPDVINKYDIYFWKPKINYFILKNKILNLYNNNFYICGNSYNKNNIFLNYALETIDEIIPKIKKKIYKS